MAVRSGRTPQSKRTSTKAEAVGETAAVESVAPSALHQELVGIIRHVKGVGPRKAEALIDAGFESPLDLAFRFPLRYLDARQLVPLNRIREYLMQAVSVRGKVISSQLIRGFKRAHTKVVLQDQSGGVLQLVYFDFPESRAKSFQVGDEYLVAGYTGMYRGVMQIVQPPFAERVDDDDALQHGRMLPIYSIPTAVRKAGIRDKQFREIVQNAVAFARERHLFREILPNSIVEHYQLVEREKAITELHDPKSPEALEHARYRLKYEEIFFLQLRLAAERAKVRRATSGTIKFDTSRYRAMLSQQPEMEVAQGLGEQVLRSLPYELTGDQKKALTEILADMAKSNGRSYPMNRLLQGDVGSGKTIVALFAMLAAIENGYQCALMVPTEVLAEQHYNTLTQILRDTSLQVSLLVGGQPKKLRDGILDSLAAGETHIVVGTHALIEKGVRFDRLGLVVTDEQHRFGVAQRKALIEKSLELSAPRDAAPDMFRLDAAVARRPVTPDVLIMTATPIPRTLALTMYGDIDVSIIREMPRNRKPIKTMLVYEHDHAKIYEAAKQRVKRKGEQVFIVYPLREKSEKVDSEAAERAYEALKLTEQFQDLRLGLIHGKLSPQDKQDVMRAFRNKEFDILIATTVIEVGIDVPNATVMIIEHAERFGLAQLHQLRGRVGRGSADSVCVLVASEKLVFKETGTETSDQLEQTSLALQRLNTLVETSDGFEVARVDMQLRGTGEILGLKQSGNAVMQIANLATDTAIVEQTLKDAERVIAADPQLRSPDNRATREYFLSQYRDAESYLNIG